MKRYHASGTIRWSDTFGLFAVSVLTGLTAGWLGYLFEAAFFHLIVIIGMTMGAAVGLIAREVVWRRRIRAPLVAATIASLGAAAAWSMVWGLDYRHHRALFRQGLIAIAEDAAARSGEPVTDDRLDEVLNATLVRWGRGEEIRPADIEAMLVSRPAPRSTGAVPPAASRLDAFRGWIRRELHVGLVIEKHGDRFTLGPRGTTILWVVEFALALAIAAELAYKASNEPFCERCQQWYGTPRWLPLGPATVKTQILDALEHGDGRALTWGMTQASPTEPYIGLRVRMCPSCSTAPVVTEVIEVLRRRKRSEEKRVCVGLVDPAILKDLRLDG